MDGCTFLQRCTHIDCSLYRLWQHADVLAADCSQILRANMSKSAIKFPKKKNSVTFPNLHTHTSTPKPSVRSHKKDTWLINRGHQFVYFLSDERLNACSSFIQQFCILWDLHANGRLSSWATEHDLSSAAAIREQDILKQREKQQHYYLKSQKSWHCTAQIPCTIVPCLRWCWAWK